MLNKQKKLSGVWLYRKIINSSMAWCIPMWSSYCFICEFCILNFVIKSWYKVLFLLRNLSKITSFNLLPNQKKTKASILKASPSWKTYWKLGKHHHWRFLQKTLNQHFCPETITMSSRIHFYSLNSYYLDTKSINVTVQLEPLSDLRLRNRNREFHSIVV